MENDIQRLTPQERSLSLKRNKEAFLLARKKRAEKLFELKKASKENLNKINLKEIETKNNTSLSIDEKKKIYADLRNQKRSLKSYVKTQKKNIISETRYESTHRHYLDAVDAFFSCPPKWIVNLIFFLIFAGIFIYFSVLTNIFNPSHGGLDNFFLFIKGLFVPDYDLFIGTNNYGFDKSVIYLCLQTFGIAFVGTLISSILTIPFGFFASKKLFGSWSYISMTILIIIRTIPEIIFCYIMIRVTGFGPITGVVVLSIQSIGMIGKMYSDNLDSIDMSFLEALDSAGASRLSKIFIGVFPQVFPNFISTILYRFDLNLRTASILGLCGAGDLGQLILTYSRNANWPQLGSLIWGLLVLILLVDFVSTSIRKKLV